jgi:hypothetical protein
MSVIVMVAVGARFRRLHALEIAQGSKLISPGGNLRSTRSSRPSVSLSLRLFGVALMGHSGSVVVVLSVSVTVPQCRS